MEYQNLICDIEDHIAVITFNRPKALNALNRTTLNELQDVFENRLRQQDIRAVIITGQGKAFVAGADIKEMDSMNPKEAGYFASLGQRVFQTIESFHAPVIAAVNGYALGGGCELAISCDIRIASQNAKFGQPEVNLGIIPGFGGTQRLTRLVGLGRAKQMIYTGDPISAAEAQAYGLVNEVYEVENLLEKAKEMAQKIASKAPIAIQLCKQGIDTGINMDSMRGIALECELFAQSFATEDSREGIAAFVEKRAAKFNGK